MSEARNREIDADTGNDISFFYRRGEPVIMLRDPRTGRFIRRLNRVEIRATNSIDYESFKKPWHNIYIDITGTTAIGPEIFENREIVEDELIKMIGAIITAKFGIYLAAELDETQTGIEYGSRVEAPDYPNAEYLVLWRHRSRAEEATQEVLSVVLDGRAFEAAIGPSTYSFLFRRT